MSVIKGLFFLCCLSLYSSSASGAEALRSSSIPQVTGIQFDRLALISGSGVAFRYLGYRYVDRAWYQGQKQDHIRWIQDWSGDTYLNLDKGGHFMAGLFVAQTLNDAYTWSGFRPRTAAVLGTLTSWVALLEVEMRDAYFDQWGFSVPDFSANTIGASIPLLYAFFPATRAVGFKFSYHPSQLYRQRRERAAAPAEPHIDHIIDDYEGMTFWATVAPEPFLRGRAKEIWPDYLGLAVGYGATGLHGSNVKSKGRERYYKDLPNARPEVFLALDYDPRYLPGKGPIWQYLKTQLNWIHLPAPTVRIYPEWRFYLLYM